MGTENGKPEPWHIEKGINISLILLVFAQIALGIWYASDFNAWRRETDRTLMRHDQSIGEIGAKNQDLARELADRLARIETKIDNLVSSRR
jgi:hypothetical protein